MEHALAILQMHSSITLKAEIPAPVISVPRSKSVPGRRAVPFYVLAAALGVLALSLSGSVFIDAELNGLHSFILRYLTLPVLVLSYAIPWIGMAGWRRTVSRAKAIFAPGLIAVVVLFTCGGVVNYANALLGTGQPIVFSGPITKLTSTSGRSGRGCYLVITETATGRTREFRITRQEYANLKVGYAYARRMHQGGLGYAYSWRR